MTSGGQAEQKAAAERLSKVEQSLGRVMEMQHLRAAVDASSADLEAARTEAAKYRRDMQVVTTKLRTGLLMTKGVLIVGVSIGTIQRSEARDLVSTRITRDS